MIGETVLAQWSAMAPWPQPYQIEQDLILSRLIVEIANHPELSQHLVFRGGTCLHKLHTDQGLRYSEDLDYVRRTNCRPSVLIDALRSIAEEVGLREGKRKLGSQSTKLFLHTEATSGTVPIKIKIEINMEETEPFLHHVSLPFKVQSRWWEGEAEVTTFPIQEILATKLRALYQRRKGRDLFDLWIGLSQLTTDDQTVMDGLAHYMKKHTPSYRQLHGNLQQKLQHNEFRTDLDPLLTSVPSGYSLDSAAALVLDRLATRLRNAPKT